MSAKRKYRVAHAGRTVTLYRWTQPGTGTPAWRFAWRDTAGRRRYTTRATREDAEAAAAGYLQRLDSGETEWLALSPARKRYLEAVHLATGSTDDDQRAVLDFLRHRRSSTEITAAVARFIGHRITAAGQETPHLRTVRLTLEGMAAHFTPATVADIHAAQLAEWWELRGDGLGPKRKKDIRGALVTFWSWAQREGIAGPDPVTVAERLPSPRIHAGLRRVLTPAEFTAIARDIAPEWRAWLVLGAFAGLRPEEIAPKRTSKLDSKRGLHCDEIDWQFGVIRLPAPVAKGGSRPRNIPLNDTLRAGLAWAGIEAGMTGPVCLRNPAEERELARLGKLIFAGPWPQDALRHSYGSARNAQLRNLPQVAEEMGNSVAMLHRHYHNPRTAEEGAEWFALRPPYAAPAIIRKNPQIAKAVPGTLRRA